MERTIKHITPKEYWHGLDNWDHDRWDKFEKDIDIRSLLLGMVHDDLSKGEAANIILDTYVEEVEEEMYKKEMGELDEYGYIREMGWRERAADDAGVPQYGEIA